MPGVQAVFHRGNLSKIYRVDPSAGFDAYLDEKRPPFEDDKIRYFGQYIALARIIHPLGSDRPVLPFGVYRCGWTRSQWHFSR